MRYPRSGERPHIGFHNNRSKRDINLIGKQGKSHSDPSFYCEKRAFSAEIEVPFIVDINVNIFPDIPGLKPLRA